MEYFNVPFTWGIYEGCGYQVFFDDVRINIKSDEEGNIDINDYISIDDAIIPTTSD